MYRDLELFTFADNFIRDFKHMKHCFLVNSAFLLPFCVTLAFVCVLLDTRDFSANFGSKSLTLFGW